MGGMPETARILPFPPGGARPRTSPELMAAAEAFFEERSGEGHFRTPMNGVFINRSFQEIMPIRHMYRPSLCVVLQGAKEIRFGDSILNYGEMDCLVVSIELPASGRMIGATPERPYLGMTIEFDVAMLREVRQQLVAPPAPKADTNFCVFVGRVDAPLADCVLRLIKMARTPEAVPILYPSVMREICYWLLTGPYGSEMAKLALPETHTERVARAIRMLHENFAQTLRVEQLAEVAGMSASSFHHHFRAMTSMTPLQFQKQLRLLEARRLMVAEAANVSDAAYKVGYESASQFSREYVRTFGTAPKRDVMNMKALLAERLK